MCDMIVTRGGGCYAWWWLLRVVVVARSSKIAMVNGFISCLLMLLLDTNVKQRNFMETYKNKQKTNRQRHAQ